MTICPHCKKAVQNLQAEDTILGVFDGQDRKGIIIKCPLCATIISAAINPLSVRDEIIKGVLDRQVPGDAE
jgi:hypothetical protein